MNKSTLMKASVLSVLSLVTSVACSSTPPAPTYQVDAYVQDVRQAPEVCNETSEGGGNSIVGALIGGVIGNQFGSGSGRIAATLVGAGGGAAIAASGRKGTGRYECRGDGYIATVSYLHPQTGQMVTKNLPLENNTRAQYISITVR